MSWSEQAWQKVDHIYDEIIESPFISQLVDGSLSRKRFNHFLSQDVLYLRDYARVLAALASKAPTLKLTSQLAQYSASVEAAELGVHEHFLEDSESTVSQRPHLSCQLYTSYLYKQVALAPFEVIAAAVLPCFWIYQKLGHYTHNNIDESNIYHRWAQSYSGEAFDESTSNMIKICDQYAAKASEDVRQKMTEAFVTASQLEQQFFNAAFDLQEWPNPEPFTGRGTQKSKNPSTALSIAGSDPSGGAGIQADIKAMSACGVFAQTAVTAVVDENTIGVYGIHAIPVAFVQSQIRSVLDDIGADAIKIGMLHSSELINGVCETLLEQNVVGKIPIVLDPVMIATSGDVLLEPTAVEHLRKDLLPLATIITPNLGEAAILLEISEQKVAEDMENSARQLSKIAKGASVLLKAGHLETKSVDDILFNGAKGTIRKMSSPRINTRNTHGTGCTLSSALAAYLARGFDLDDAAEAAKSYIADAIAAAQHQNMAKGCGPVQHFFNHWD